MSYTRVLPRDLFNEANLLKCYGRLAICLDEKAGQHGAKLGESWAVHSFDVEQEIDGELFIANLPLLVGDREFVLVRPLNSRRAWPLYVEDPKDDGFGPVEVFDDEGNLSAEMMKLIGAS